MVYHKPVLLEESINGLNIKPEGIYVDLTFGGGGHSRGILGKLGKKGRLLAFDQDIDAGKNILNDPRFTFIHSSFRFLRNFLRYYGISEVDGVLADLGISSHQIDLPERGFSFMKEGPLDMRMNRDMKITASDILNEYEERELIRLLREFGELPDAKSIAKKICALRENKRIETTTEFTAELSKLAPKHNQNKFMAQIYQALRIEVNREMESLKELLSHLPEMLRSGGRAVFLTYHSIEDRIVKNFFRSGNFSGQAEKDFYGNLIAPFRLINKGVLTPSETELSENPRARSAKLRIAEKI